MVNELLSEKPIDPMISQQGFSYPVLCVNNTRSLEHIIAFADAETPTFKGLPEGVFGCEIWCKVGGDAPEDLSQFTFLGTDTQTPYHVSYQREDSGKTVHYLARWSIRSGETGAWGDVVSVVIK